MVGLSRTSAGDALFDDPAVVDEDDPIGHLPGKTDLVGDDDQRGAGTGEILDDGEHLADQFGIQGRGRLVEQHDLRFHRQGSGDGDPLLLAAGQLARIGGCLVGHA